MTEDLFARACEKNIKVGRRGIAPEGLQRALYSIRPKHLLREHTQRHANIGPSMDESGRLLVANPGLGYVWVLGPRAEPEEVLTGSPGTSITNLAFGGKDRRTLYCTDSTHGHILMAEMSVAGAVIHRLA